MTRYLYRVVDRDGEHHGVFGGNYEPQLYWGDDEMEPDGDFVPHAQALWAADREHPAGAPHRWQRIRATAWEEVPSLKVTDKSWPGNP